MVLIVALSSFMFCESFELNVGIVKYSEILIQSLMLYPFP